jgi:hypothetical protein
MAASSRTRSPVTPSAEATLPYSSTLTSISTLPFVPLASGGRTGSIFLIALSASAPVFTRLTTGGLLIAKANEINKPSNLPGDESDEYFDEPARGAAVEGMLTKRWRIVGPATTLVRSLTPEFKWTSTVRADSYEVSIYDDLGDHPKAAIHDHLQNRP